MPVKRVNGVVPKSVFLAGSIEMDTAVNWQAAVTKDFERLGADYVFNPRRDDFDASQKQSKENDYFHGQVSWEITALDIAETIYMYFDPKTKSPISLLELGMYVTSGKMVIVCPNGFWRKGNVDIVCERFSIPVYDNITESFFDKHLDFIAKRN